jgi:hypothetical protein
MPPARDLQDTRFLVLQTVLRVFSDPINPKLCEIALLGGLATLEELLQEDQTGVQLDALRDATVSWVMAPRTQAEMTALYQRLSCQCSDEDRRTPTIEQFMHRAGQNRFGQSKHTLPIQSLLVALLRPFHDLKHAMVTKPVSYVFFRPEERQRTAQMSGLQVPWPRHVRQLLPYGAEDSIRGLFAWFRLETDMVVRLRLYDSLQALLQTCSTAIIPALVRSRIFARVLLEGLQSDNTTWHRNHGHQKHIRRDIIQSIAATGLILRCIQTEGFGMNTSHLSDHFPSELILWCDKTIALLDRFKSVDAAFPSHLEDILGDSLYDCRLRFVTLAGNTLRDHPQLRSEPLMCFREIESAAQDGASKSWKVWARLKRVVLILRRYQRCAAPFCHSTFTGNATRFRYCGGCRRIPYCSRRCQKFAWRYTGAPHRNVCQPLRSVYLHWNLSLKSRIDLEDLEWDVDTDFVSAANIAVSHFEALEVCEPREHSYRLGYGFHDADIS